MTYEIADVASIAREGALVQLAAVPGANEELDGVAQGLDGPREAGGAARSWERYTRQDRALLCALGHYLAALLQEQELQARLAEQGVQLRALQGDGEPLTPEELEVLPYVAQGLTNKEIARTVCVHPRTVEKRLSSIYDKWGVPGRREAVQVARRKGVLPHK